MRRTIILLTTFLLFAANIHAQTGVYLSYEDFKNGNLTKADPKSLVVVQMKHELKFKLNGEAKTYETKDIFGILVNGNLLRFPVGPIGNIDAKLIEANKDYFLWYFTETYYDPNNISGQANGGFSKDAVFYVSYKIDGDLIDITMNGRLSELDKHSEFKPLDDCVKAGKKLSLMHPLMAAIGECMYKDPSFVKDLKTIIPAIK